MRKDAIARQEEAPPDSCRLYWFVAIVLVVATLMTLLVVAWFFAIHTPHD